MPDPYALEDEEEIPTMEEQYINGAMVVADNSYEVGLQFDGLTRGINMTISVQYHLREITCRYEGRIVYQEIAGELEGYAPDPAWESKIESLHLLSRKLERQRRPLERAMKIEKNKRDKAEVLEYLRNKWGL